MAGRLEDGLIGNVKACRAKFNIASLRCLGGWIQVWIVSLTTGCTLRMLASHKKLGVTLSGIDTLAPWPSWIPMSRLVPPSSGAATTSKSLSLALWPVEAYASW